MERVQLRYHATAQERGAIVVSALGFDCVAAEVGATLCATALAAHAAQPAATEGSDGGQSAGPQWAPHRVESRVTLEWGPAGFCGHFATLCASAGARHAD